MSVVALTKRSSAGSIVHYSCSAQLERRSDMTKTATLPAIRISPALRAQAEHLLGEGETLSAFIVESLEHNIDRRRMQREFIARGLAAADNARAQNRYTTAATVMRRLKAQIDNAKREQADRDKRR